MKNPHNQDTKLEAKYISIDHFGQEVYPIFAHKLAKIFNTPL